MPHLFIILLTSLSLLLGQGITPAFAVLPSDMCGTSESRAWLLNNQNDPLLIGNTNLLNNENPDDLDYCMGCLGGGLPIVPPVGDSYGTERLDAPEDLEQAINDIPKDMTETLLMVFGGGLATKATEGLGKIFKADMENAFIRQFKDVKARKGISDEAFNNLPQQQQNDLILQATEELADPSKNPSNQFLKNQDNRRKTLENIGEVSKDIQDKETLDTLKEALKETLQWLELFGS